MKKKKKKGIKAIHVVSAIIGILLIVLVIKIQPVKSAIFPYQGGTGSSTNPTHSQLLVGEDSGVYAPSSVLSVASTSLAVGINDIYPDAALEVVSASAGQTYFMLSTDAAGDGDVLIVDSDGSLGISDSTPDAALEVVSGSGSAIFMVSSTSTGDGDYFIVKDTGNVGIGDNTPDAALEITTTSGASTFFMISDGTSGDGDFFVVDGGGNVGIGDASPEGNLDVVLSQNLSEVGNVCIDTNNVFSNETDGTCDSSSLKVKTDIRNLTYGIDTVMQLRPITFRYKEDFKPEFQLNRAGFIAEEMHEIIPEVTTYDNEGLPDGIDYKRITAITVKAIQELHKMIENIEVGDPSGLISNLEAEVEELEKRVDELESRTVKQNWWERLVDYFR